MEIDVTIDGHNPTIVKILDNAHLDHLVRQHVHNDPQIYVQNLTIHVHIIHEIPANQN